MKKKLLIKIISFLFLSSTTLFFLLFYFNSVSQNNELKKSFMEQGKATSYSLESCIAGKEDFDNKNLFFSRIYKAMLLNPDINEISFNLLQEDNYLFTVISSNPSKINQKAKAVNLDILSQNNSYSQLNNKSLGDVLVVTSPLYVSGQLEGTVEISFALRNTEEQINKASFQLLIYYFIILICFIVLGYIFLRRQIIKPILSLKFAVDEINKGNFSYQLKDVREDELGELGLAFNKMANDLAISKNISNDLKKHQEIIIDERTKDLSSKIVEIERINKFMVDRELKMIELKNELELLKNKLKE